MKQLKHLRFLAVILLIVFVVILLVVLITDPPNLGLSTGAQTPDVRPAYLA